jgi:TonB family protein
MTTPFVKKSGTSSVFLAPALMVLSMIASFTQTASAQQAVPSGAAPSEAEIARIIATFTRKEAEFRRALNNFSFKRDATLQSVGMGGQVTGEFHRVSYFTFDDKGNRYEKITIAPMSTLPNVTQEDIDDLGGINPFALEPPKIDQYNFRYVGKERIDELDLYVFDVTPKVLPDPKRIKERLFTGRVWVEDRDLQIVKTRGKGVPETKNNKYPYVETYREEINGHYWFPTYSFADEELVFDSGESLHVRMQVRYSDFVPAHVTVNIREAEDQTGATKPDAPVASPATPSATPSPGTAPTRPIDRSQPVEGGNLNAKAIELPEPKLSEGAARLGGKVRVRVIVDETGTVISAEIEDGRIELRRSALEAARKARFAPALIDGQPIKVTGILTYLFVQ